MPNWPLYESHKIVQAAPIVRIEHDTQARAIMIWVGRDDGSEELFEPTETGMATHAVVGGYAVKYDDGFKSISPKAAFEAGYTRVSWSR